ncbi:MAG: LysR family transcriptional regulator [Selenomonadaceae bacterium]|nr:LysR family transcriptional regulator [Selenomonadaceae bacterium]MBR1858782.1 LysR family transcriptional regulator [Selenomonadaceae bacterium]
MIKQMKYFQAVVRYQNFTKAAEECYISQSAISQQIQALEKELGIQLLQREKRKISLTTAGEYFYRKSLVIVSDFDRLCSETKRLAKGVEHELTIGYLRHYRGIELKEAITEFNVKCPEVFLQLVQGTHEELYDYLRNGKADVVLSDLRRKPSEQYVNYFLTNGYVYAELAINNPLAQLETITVNDLKNTPIILIAPQHQKHNEEIFYREYLGVKSDFIYAENLEEAHLMVVSNKGYFPIEFNQPPAESKIVKYVPIIHKDKQVYRKYYAFWRADTTKDYIEEFAAILKPYFPE